jgi:hypothetical protein
MWTNTAVPCFQVKMHSGGNFDMEIVSPPRRLISEIWKTITPEMCHNYCAYYERRLLADIATGGGYTKINNCFSRHKNVSCIVSPTI